jgi:hypothetical protein
VCRRGFCQLLGIGGNRLTRVNGRYRGSDFRGLGNHIHHAHAAMSCRHFFLETYHSTAEVLPHKFEMMTSPQESGDLATTIKAMIDSLDTSRPQDQLRGPTGLSVRHLPPGKITDLFQLYQSSCQVAKTKCAASSTFYNAES